MRTALEAYKRQKAAYEKDTSSETIRDYDRCMELLRQATRAPYYNCNGYEGSGRFEGNYELPDGRVFEAYISLPAYGFIDRVTIWASYEDWSKHRTMIPRNMWLDENRAMSKAGTGKPSL